MSESDVAFSQEDLSKVLEMAAEPSYISEIARKLREVDEDWAEMSENAAVGKVTAIVAFAEENLEGRVELVKPFENYEGLDSEEEGSPHQSIVQGEGKKWMDYVIVHSEVDFGDVREEFLEVLDTNVTVGSKSEVIRTLSEMGNQVARNSERILKDVCSRQFRDYERTGASLYESPGIDFFVYDDDRRQWGLAVEISTRWVNPIDNPYLESKKEMAFEDDLDLVIVAPRFTQQLHREYEDPDSDNWHANPLEERVHLHRVPDKKPNVYKPFATRPEDFEEGEFSVVGNPVIVPDSQKLRNRLEQVGNVGDSYPVVGGDFNNFREVLDDVFRDYRVVTESRYRHMIREALEPLLWEFMRPYRIEQFLLDSYWDKELTQSEIGNLVDRSGSTIGRWMRQDNWDIIRRGTGAPELSDQTVEIWRRMYEGTDPFPEEFSGYRIQAEWNRHPFWDLQDWRDWYETTTEEERREVVGMQESYQDNMDYTVMAGAQQRLVPSYSFIMRTLREEGVDIRAPDLAPRVPYNAYPSRDALEWMINREFHTIEEEPGGEDLA